HRCIGTRTGLATASRKNSRKGSSTTAPLPAEGTETETIYNRRCTQNYRRGTGLMESLANRSSQRTGAGIGCSERHLVRASSATYGFLAVDSTHEVFRLRNPACAFARRP